jgi:hypothetical protein
MPPPAPVRCRRRGSGSLGGPWPDCIRADGPGVTGRPVRMRAPAVGRDPPEGSTEMGHGGLPVLGPRPSQHREARDRAELGFTSWLHRERAVCHLGIRGGRPPEWAAGRPRVVGSGCEALVGWQGQFTVCEDRRGRSIDRQQASDLLDVIVGDHGRPIGTPQVVVDRRAIRAEASLRPIAMPSPVPSTGATTI